MAKPVDSFNIGDDLHAAWVWSSLSTDEKDRIRSEGVTSPAEILRHAPSKNSTLRLLRNRVERRTSRKICHTIWPHGSPNSYGPHFLAFCRMRMAEEGSRKRALLETTRSWKSTPRPTG